MYKSLSIVYDELMDVDYNTYQHIIDQELGDRRNLLILDLGCGSGNMLDSLLKFGEVYAIDNSSEMLAIASSKNPNCNFFEMSLLDIESLNKKFDFIVSAFDVFNYLEDIEQFKDGLKAVYNCLNAGGTFIFDIHTPKKVNYMLDEQVFAYDSDNISYLWFTYPTDVPLEVESELTFFVKNKEGLYKKIEQYQKQRTYDIINIFNVIEQIGFEVKNYFCDFDKDNKNYNQSDRLIFVLEK